MTIFGDVSMMKRLSMQTFFEASKCVKSSGSVRSPFCQYYCILWGLIQSSFLSIIGSSACNFNAFVTFRFLPVLWLQMWGRPLGALVGSVISTGRLNLKVPNFEVVFLGSWASWPRLGRFLGSFRPGRMSARAERLWQYFVLDKSNEHVYST